MTMISEERMLTISRQAFRLFLYAYPAKFRKDYGVEMVQVFRDDMRGTLQANGLAGLPGLWSITFFDLLKTALAERVWEIFHMPDNLFTRLVFGVAAAIGAPLLYMTFASGFFWKTYSALGLPSGNLVHPILAGSGLFLMGLGLYGIYRRLPPSNLARLGLFVAEVGVTLALVAMIFWEKQVGQTFLELGFVLHPIGLALMGIVAQNNKSLGRLSLVPLAVVAAFAGFVVATATASQNMGNAAVQLFLALNYAGWVLLGVAIALPGAEEPSGPMMAA